MWIAGDPNPSGKATLFRVATGAVPTVLVLPSVSGSATAGNTLTADPGAWTYQPGSYAYRWERCSTATSGCAVITGATAQRYTVIATDAGRYLRVGVTATNLNGTSARAYSPTIADGDTVTPGGGTASPTAAIVRIMETAAPRAILGFGDEADLTKLLQFPTSVVSCDCGATARPTGHPRNAGTFPRVLGRYVREQRVLTWEEAIRKMSGLPATVAGLVDRGYVAAGMAADVLNKRTLPSKQRRRSPPTPTRRCHWERCRRRRTRARGRPFPYRRHRCLPAGFSRTAIHQACRWSARGRLSRP
jgi:hypothetical protein